MTNVVRVGVAVFVHRDGKILLGKRKGAHGAGTYAPPGGHVELGENPFQTAAREVYEETGMTILALSVHDARPWTYTVFAEGLEYVTLFFDAGCDGKPQVLEPDKCEGWDWYALDDLPSPLFGALPRVL